MADTIYNVMYEINATISIGVNTTTDPMVYQIASSDIVSIAIIHRYDTATYPIIRLRFYADMALVENICDAPDDVYAGFYANGGIYKVDGESNVKVNSVESLDVYGKAYIEHKNLPVSKMDQFKQGIKDETNLNVDSKVEFEIFIYDNMVTHKMRQRCPSIYRNTTVESVCYDLFTRVGLALNQINIKPLHNQTYYTQLLIPNMTSIDAISYLDRFYGLYKDGGMIYYDITTTPSTMYLCDTSSTRYSSDRYVPIYVRSEKFNSDEGGMCKINNTTFGMQTYATNASVLTESDIESTLNPERIDAINVMDYKQSITDLPRLFGVSNIDNLQDRIEQKNILHKNPSEYVSIQEAARLNEKITRIDLSGAGFDIASFTPDARINLIFESPIRGLKMDELYRIRYVCHVLTNTSGNLFVSQSTMNLCSNYGMASAGGDISA